MGGSWALTTPEFAKDPRKGLGVALPEACAPASPAPFCEPSRIRLPFTSCFVRVRSLALCVSVAVHVLVFGALAIAKLAVELPAPPPLIEVDFVEIPGPKGGGGSGPVPATPRFVAAAPRPQAVSVPDLASRQSAPSAPQAEVAATASGPVQGQAIGNSGGSGGGSGGGIGTGSGSSVGSGTGQGGVAVDRMPTVLRRVKPVYPMDARRRGISGQVVLRLFVDPEGSVREVQVHSSEPAGVFEEKALEAVRRWRFSPAMFKGAPVGVWMTLPVRFTLEER